PRGNAVQTTVPPASVAPFRRRECRTGFGDSLPVSLADARVAGCGMLLSMNRPSLKSAMSRLAELCAQRGKLAAERVRVVASNGPDRQQQLEEIGADRLTVEAAIREAKATVMRLQAGRRERKARPAGWGRG